MSNPRSLMFQHSCVVDAHALARNDEIRAGLEAAAATLKWLADHAELLKMTEALRRGRPELYEAMNQIAVAFPDARIVEVT